MVGETVGIPELLDQLDRHMMDLPPITLECKCRYASVCDCVVASRVSCVSVHVVYQGRVEVEDCRMSDRVVV